MQVFKSQRNALLAIAAAFLYWYVHFPLLSETIYEIKDAAHAAWSITSFYVSLCFFLVWLFIFKQGLCLPLAWSCTVFPAVHILWMDNHVAWGHIHEHFTGGHINCVVGTYYEPLDMACIWLGLDSCAILYAVQVVVQDCKDAARLDSSRGTCEESQGWVKSYSCYSLCTPYTVTPCCTQTCW